MWPKLPQILFMADGAAGAGGAAGGAAAAAGGGTSGGAASPTGAAGGTGDPSRTGATGGGQGAQPASGEPPKWTAPDFLPEHLRDADMGKTFEKLAADWKLQRDNLAKAPQAAKSVDEYKFDPSDKIKPFIAGELAQDPAFAAAREVALKAGMPAELFNKFVGGFYEALVDKGALPKPYSAENERDALIGPNARGMTKEQKDAAIRPIVLPAAQFLEGLQRTGAVDAAGFAELGQLLDSAAGVRAVQAIMKLAKDAPGLNPGGQASTGGKPTHADLKARQRDPRNDPNSVQFDKGFRDQTNAMYREVFQ